MASTKARKLILIRSDLLDKISQITAKEGKTMYSFTNEIFEQVLKTYEMNATISDVVEFYMLMQVEKESGAVVIPMTILEDAIKKLYKENKEELLKKWYDTGLWYGKYISSGFYDKDPLGIIEKLMKNCLRNLTNCSVSREDGQVKIRAMSPHLSLEYTLTLSKFLEGILHSLNYSTSKNECLKGIILLEFNAQKQ